MNIAQMSQKLSAGNLVKSPKVVVIMLIANNDFAVLNWERNQFSVEMVDLHANYPLPHVLPVGGRN